MVIRIVFETAGAGFPALSSNRTKILYVPSGISLVGVSDQFPQISVAPV